MAIERSINANTELVELKGSNYEIVDGEPNVIGWSVKNTKGKKIGDVDDLLFDPSSRKVRYLVIDFEDNDLELENKRRVLIPIGVAVLYEKYDDVIIPDITLDQLSYLPPYHCDTFDYHTETTIRKVFEKGAVSNYTEPTLTPEQRAEFYKHDHFNETKFYTRRSPDPNSTVTPGEEIVPVDGETVNENERDYQRREDAIREREDYLADEELKRRLDEDRRRNDL